MLKCCGLLVCLVGFQLSGCGAIHEQDFDSEDHAQTAPSAFHGLGSSGGLQIMDGNSGALVVNTSNVFVVYYAYVNQWAQQGVASEFSHVSVTPHLRGAGVTILNRIEDIPLGAEAGFGAISLDLTSIVQGANVACAFDYSHVQIIEPASIRVDGYDDNNDGLTDLNKLDVDLAFTAEVPLQRPDSSSDNCVTKKYTFRAPSQVILYPEQTFGPSPPAAVPSPAQASCKFKRMPFSGVEWYYSGVTLNHCLCNDGTWVSTTGQYCKNWN